MRLFAIKGFGSPARALKKSLKVLQKRMNFRPRFFLSPFDSATFVRRKCKFRFTDFKMNSILQAITVLQEEIDAKNPERKKEREAANKQSFFSTISKKLRGSGSSKEKKKKTRLSSSKSLSASTSPAAAPSINKQQTFRRSKTEWSNAFSRKGKLNSRLQLTLVEKVTN